jgi:hypothetical protein
MSLTYAPEPVGSQRVSPATTVVYLHTHDARTRLRTYKLFLHLQEVIFAHHDIVEHSYFATTDSHASR